MEKTSRRDPLVDGGFYWTNQHPLHHQPSIVVWPTQHSPGSAVVSRSTSPPIHCCAAATALSSSSSEEERHQKGSSSPGVFSAVLEQRRHSTSPMDPPFLQHRPCAARRGSVGSSAQCPSPSHSSSPSGGSRMSSPLQHTSPQMVLRPHSLYQSRMSWRRRLGMQRRQSCPSLQAFLDEEAKDDAGHKPGHASPSSPSWGQGGGEYGCEREGQGAGKEEDARRRRRRFSSAMSFELDGDAPRPSVELPRVFDKPFEYTLHAALFPGSASVPPRDAKETEPEGEEEVQEDAGGAAALRGHSVREQIKFKTEICRSFEETGTCVYGEKCKFAHGTDELRSLPEHRSFKTRPCRFFFRDGGCKYGKQCFFIHRRERLPHAQHFMVSSSLQGLPCMQQLRRGEALEGTLSDHEAAMQELQWRLRVLEEQEERERQRSRRKLQCGSSTGVSSSGCEGGAGQGAQSKKRRRKKKKRRGGGVGDAPAVGSGSGSGSGSARSAGLPGHEEYFQQQQQSMTGNGGRSSAHLERFFAASQSRNHRRRSISSSPPRMPFYQRAPQPVPMAMRSSPQLLVPGHSSQYQPQPFQQAPPPPQHDQHHHHHQQQHGSFPGWRSHPPPPPLPPAPSTGGPYQFSERRGVPPPAQQQHQHQQQQRLPPARAVDVHNRSFVDAFSGSGHR